MTNDDFVILSQNKGKVWMFMQVQLTKQNSILPIIKGTTLTINYQTKLLGNHNFFKKLRMFNVG